MRVLIIGGMLAALSGGVPVWAQHSTARDAFWSARDLVSVSTNPGVKSSGTGTKRKDAKTTATVKTPPATPARAHLDPLLVAENGYGAQPHLVRVSDDQIGLRYSLLLRDTDGKYMEASPTATFHSGDLLKLSVMANQPGYLYVVQQGSSGSWLPLFPTKGSAAETNRVEQGRVVEIPGGKGAFQFDSTPGNEKIFIVLSRRPVQDLDTIISGLKAPGGQTNPQPPGAAPDTRVYEASNRIPDELVRRFASRDLSFVEVQDTRAASKKPEDTGEKAVYVVSKGVASSFGPQVVATVDMRHE